MLFAFVSAPNKKMCDVAKINEHHIRTPMIQYTMSKETATVFQGEDPIFYSTEK